MSSRFLTAEQQHSYGRYVGEPTSVQLAHYFHLDDSAKQLVQKRRGDHNRLGFAIQLCTVRFLGTFLINPIDVPSGVINYLAVQLKIGDVDGLTKYVLRSNTHWEHTLIIKKHYGYCDFSDQPGHWRLVRWLYQRAWIGGESPSMMFDLTTARLVEQKILLPGVTVLSRLISAVRERVIPGTLRDSLVVLVGLLEQQTSLRPRELMTDTSGYSDVVFGLFWLLGYQFSPRERGCWGSSLLEVRFWGGLWLS